MDDFNAKKGMKTVLMTLNSGHFSSSTDFLNEVFLTTLEMDDFSAKKGMKTVLIDWAEWPHSVS